MEKKGQIWTVVLVALVVAIIASVATASITGNVIKQKNDIYGNYEIYTKQEVDFKLNSLKTTIYGVESPTLQFTNGVPKEVVYLNASKYTVEMVGASDTSAIIKVTNPYGTSESKEVNEGASKIVAGLKVNVINADESNLVLTSTVRVNLLITATCTDSDGGANLFVQGVASNGVTSQTDGCISTSRLSEAICANSTIVTAQGYDCPAEYYCGNGKCLK